MRIFDENDNEIKPQDVDGYLGYLEVEKKIIKHYDAVEEVPQVSHLAVSAFYFTDGTSIQFDDEHDPHIKIIDAENGIFEYISDPEEESKYIQSIDLYTVVDIPGIPAIEPHDEIEYIQRYKLFTPAEIEQNKAREEEEERQQRFLEVGEQQIKHLEERIQKLEDIIFSKIL